MNISDAKLSAFLDQELPHTELEAIRDAIAQQPELADRLAMLSQVDAAVHDFATRIDSEPMSTQLQRQVFGKAENVVTLSFWQRKRQQFALAASITLLVGLGAFQWWPVDSELQGGQWVAMTPSLSSGLSSLPSGETRLINATEVLQPQFSFTAGDGRLCRSYELVSAGESAQIRNEIACHQQGQWQIIASIARTGSHKAEYRPASAHQYLNDVLAELDAGPSLSLAEELQLLTND